MEDREQMLARHERERTEMRRSQAIERLAETPYELPSSERIEVLRREQLRQFLTGEPVSAGAAVTADALTSWCEDFARRTDDELFLVSCPPAGGGR